MKKIKHKQEVDQVNIWYSPAIDKWVICCLVVYQGDLLRREKTQWDTLEKALSVAKNKYKSRAKNNF
jgi:hypothetical protein